MALISSPLKSILVISAILAVGCGLPSGQCILEYDSSSTAKATQLISALPDTTSQWMRSCGSARRSDLDLSSLPNQLALSLDSTLVQSLSANETSQLLASPALATQAKLVIITQSRFSPQQLVSQRSLRDTSLLTAHDSTALKSGYLEELSMRANDKPVSIFLIQDVEPSITRFELVDGLRFHQVSSFFTKSVMDYGVISLVARHMHLEGRRGVCTKLANQLEEAFPRRRDIWTRLQLHYDPTAGNKLGQMVNCFSRPFTQHLIGNFVKYDYSQNSLASVFRFMDRTIPPALANPLLSDFLWMKRYSYDFYLGTVATPEIIPHISPSFFLYELNVIRYNDLKRTLAEPLLRSTRADPINVDMLFLKLHASFSDGQASERLIHQMNDHNVHLEDILPYFSMYGTRALSKESWKDLGPQVFDNLEHMIPQDHDVARLVFDNISRLLQTREYRAKKLIPLLAGIPSSFIAGSTSINSVEMEYLIQKPDFSLDEMTPPAREALLSRSPINRDSLQSFASRPECHKFKILSAIPFVEYLEFLEGDQSSRMTFESSELSLNDACKYSQYRFSPLQLAARLRGYMRSHPEFELSYTSLRLLEKSVAGLLVSDIANLPVVEANDIIYLMTQHTVDYQRDPYLAKAMAEKLLENSGILAEKQFGIEKPLTWHNIPDVYLFLFDGFLFRQLSPSFFTMPDGMTHKLRERCSDVVSQIGHSEGLKEELSTDKMRMLTEFHFACQERSGHVTSDDLIALGSLVCELTPQQMMTLSGDSVRDYGYLFRDCCLSKAQGQALRVVSEKAALTHQDLYFSFGTAWLAMIDSGDNSSVSFVEDDDKERVFVEQLTQISNRAVIQLRDGSCKWKLASYDSKQYEKALGTLVTSVFTRQSRYSAIKLRIRNCHDQNARDQGVSCNTLKSLGEGIRYLSRQQLDSVSDCDFQKCVAFLGRLRHLREWQRVLVSSRIVTLRNEGQAIQDVGSFGPDIAREGQDFRDIDTLSLVSYSGGWTETQLQEGFKQFMREQKLNSVSQLTSLHVAALGNFLCGAVFNELLYEPGLPEVVLKHSLRTFSQLSLCDVTKMRELYLRLQSLGVVKNSIRQLTEFDIHDMGYLVSGIHPTLLDDIAITQPHILAYTEADFLANIAIGDLRRMSCSFFRALNPSTLRALQMDTLRHLPAESQKCIAGLLNGGIIPLHVVQKMNGVFVEPDEPSLAIEDPASTVPPEKTLEQLEYMYISDEEQLAYVRYIIISSATKITFYTSTLTLLLISLC